MDIKSIATVLSVLVALGSLLYTWRRERSSDIYKRAAQCRQLVADVFQKVTRWQQLALRPYVDIQPVLVDVDSNFSDAFRARDLVWRQFHTLNNESNRAISEEALNTCYVALLPSLPSLVQVFELRVRLMCQLQEIVFDLCNAIWQSHLLIWAGKEKGVQPAQIGNLLRAAFYRYESILRSASDRLISDLTICTNTISQTEDKSLIRRNYNIKCPEVPTLDQLLLSENETQSDSYDLKRDLQMAIESLETQIVNRPCHISLRKTLGYCKELYDRLQHQIGD